MNIVRLDWHVAWRVALLALLLAWPLILFGRPSYFSDSLSYYKGGKAAVTLEIGKIASLFRAAPFQPTTATIAGVKPLEASAEEARGARSISYSLAAYLLSAPDGKMIALVLMQAMAAALTITIVAMSLGAIEPWKFMLLAVTLVVATPVACFANSAVPDIFAGLIICIFAVLAIHLNRLSGGVRLTLTVIGAFAVASHTSHLLLATGVFMLGLISIVFAQPGIERRSRLVGWLLAPLGLGVATTILSGFIGFGEVSIAPKRFPFALARSVEDGPARWYLEQNCATHRYAVCEVFGNDFPLRAGAFLWGEHGLRYRATPEQMDRIRAEESEIVLRAVQAYPYAQATRTFRNIWRQLFHFGLAGTQFDQPLAIDAEGKPYLESLPDAHGWVLSDVEALSILSTLLCLGWVFWHFRVLLGDARTILLLITAGILGNAVICAVFSGVADRYQARVIWVLPMVSIALMLRSRNAAAIASAAATSTPGMTELGGSSAGMASAKRAVGNFSLGDEA
jgi:hypothetical protein